MIKLKMECSPDGTQKPLALIINGELYVYQYNDNSTDGNKPEQEFFNLLEKYRNYKIEVQKYNPEGDFIKAKNYILRGIHRNSKGILSLDLD